MTKEEKAQQYAELAAKHSIGNANLIEGVFIDGYTKAEQDSEEMIKQFIQKWESDKALWRTVLDNPLFHTKEQQMQASGKVLAITAMLSNFKELFLKESLNKES